MVISYGASASSVFVPTKSVESRLDSRTCPRLAWTFVSSNNASTSFLAESVSFFDANFNCLAVQSASRDPFPIYETETDWSPEILQDDYPSEELRSADEITALASTGRLRRRRSSY